MKTFDEVKNYLRDRNSRWCAVEHGFKAFKEETCYSGTLKEYYDETGASFTKCFKDYSGLYTQAYWERLDADLHEFCGENAGPRYKLVSRRKLVCVIEEVLESDEKDLVKIVQKQLDSTAFYAEHISGTNNWRVYGTEKLLVKL